MRVQKRLRDKMPPTRFARNALLASTCSRFCAHPSCEGPATLFRRPAPQPISRLAHQRSLRLSAVPRRRPPTAVGQHVDETEQHGSSNEYRCDPRQCSASHRVRQRICFGRARSPPEQSLRRHVFRRWRSTRRAWLGRCGRIRRFCCPDARRWDERTRRIQK
jgi:hypothetical protein